MRNLRVAAARSEVPHKQTHRVPRLLEPSVRPRSASGRRHQVAVQPRRVGIRDDNIRLYGLAIRQPDTAGFSAIDHHLRDVRVQAELAAQSVDQVQKPADQHPGAADRKVHAPLALQVSDQGVDRRRRERIPPYEQRMKTQRLPELGVLDEPCHEAIHGQVALKPDHVRDDPHHAPHRVERYVSEAGESDVEDPFAHRQEPVVPGFVVGRQATDFLSHELGVRPSSRTRRHRRTGCGRTGERAAGPHCRTAAARTAPTALRTGTEP